MRFHRGFTIVELVIAVLILSVGILGLTTTAGLVTRMIRQGADLSEVAALASRRLELLRGAVCPPVGTGVALERGFTVSWRVTDLPVGNGRLIYASVRSPANRGGRTHFFETARFCR